MPPPSGTQEPFRRARLTTTAYRHAGLHRGPSLAKLSMRERCFVPLRPQHGSAATSARTRGKTAMDFPPDEVRFAAMLAESGMPVPPEQRPSLFEGYRHMLRLIALLGSPEEMDAEPAVTFAATAPPEERR
jgi:hypothetical protein